MVSQGPQVVLVDTDVYSYIRKNRPEAVSYLPHLQGVVPALSFVTVGELYKWAFSKNWFPKSISELEADFERYLILPYNQAVARHWARIQTAVPGRRFPVNDAWTAACALAYGCTILTHNRRDFHDIPGLSFVSYAPEI